MSSSSSEFYIRTEDIPAEELVTYFVETTQDRDIVDRIKARTPVVLVGSRGVGKSFLMQIAEQELSQCFSKERVVPVYTSFNKSALLATSDPLQFQHYMLARICSRTLRALMKHGAIPTVPAGVSILSGGASAENPTSRMDGISRAYENSFHDPGKDIDHSGLPTVEALRDAVEDLCRELNIKRIALLMDEAAHVFRPEQQRQFFTLFRDLRSPYISCNAAVYPGVTSYGDIFQPSHDAAFVVLDRDVLGPTYVDEMRSIVEKQASSTLAADIAKNGQNFAALAYAASGNPRLLLKTVSKAGRLNAAQVNEIVKEFYRTDLWAEHSGLPDKYPGHRAFIDWGRTFVESTVLPEIQKRNEQALKDGGETTCFFWIHRDAPEVVREALRLLEYTGIVREHTRGIKATRAEIGTRYAVNLGCLFALEVSPRDTAGQIWRKLGARRFVEYGANHSAYKSLTDVMPSLVESDMVRVLQEQLAKPISVLEITDWQKSQLEKIGASTIGAVLTIHEAGLQAIKYVGEKRARRMINAAQAAVLEYVSG
jgi:hypothetical protein